MPSGILNPNSKCLIGNGCVVHLPKLFEELKQLDEKGINYSGRFFISDRAHIVFGFHQKIDGLSEGELGGAKLGTTGRGIGPSYCEKANRSNIRIGDLKNMSNFKARLNKIVSSAQRRFIFEYDIDAEVKLYEEFSKKLEPYIVDGVEWINEQYKKGQKILLEGANATMLDIDFGTYPYVTSSNPTVGGCITGTGLSHNKLGDVIGVVKAYTTRVGEGPFPTELLDEYGTKLREVGAEYGTTTGRPRRCGWLDAVVIQYSNTINGYTALNLTKLDILSGMDEIKVGVEYHVEGRKLSSFPASLEVLSKVKVEYQTFPGWKEDISKCEKFSELPPNCQKYVLGLESLFGVPIKWIGVGPGRHSLVEH